MTSPAEPTGGFAGSIVFETRDRAATRHLRRVIVAVVVVLGIGLSGCGSATPTTTASTSSGTTASAATSTTTTTPTASSRSATTAAIKADWDQFFASATPAARKLQLLENGTKFTSVLDALVKATKSFDISSSVSKVVLDSPSEATVTYSLALAGQTALRNQSGTAVLEQGTWKVGVSSFCALVVLEQQSVPSCPTPSGAS